MCNMKPLKKNTYMFIFFFLKYVLVIWLKYKIKGACIVLPDWVSVHVSSAKDRGFNPSPVKSIIQIENLNSP